MEVIDEKGRVFGVVNVIDLLVVLLILAVLAAGVALVFGNDGAAADQSESVTLTVRADGVQPYVADAIPSPGKLNGGNITNIDNVSVEPATVVTTNDTGHVLTREHPRLKTVTVTVTVEATRTDGTLVLGNQRLKVGERVALDLNTVDLQGEVTTVETEE